VAYCQTNYELSTNEPYTLNVSDCQSYGARKMGFLLTAGTYNHTISMINCFSANDGTSGSFSASDRVGFYLTGAGCFQIRNCNVEGESRTQYAWRHEPTATTMDVLTGEGNVRDLATGPLYYSGAIAYSARWRDNAGYVTANDVLSGTFAIDSTGVKTVTITHGLAVTPNVEDCYLTVVQNTAVDDWAFNLLKVTATSSTTVTAKINVSTASATGSATAKLGLKVGK
jgi:hypothetical protein